MVDICADNMNDIYKHICNEIIVNGTLVGNTRELNNFSFELTNLNNNVIGVRDISEVYLCAELTWYMLARKDVAFINPFAGLWGRISDDGVTSYSAYGDIVFKRHGFDQADKIIELLATDKNSRRAVINFNVPNKNVIQTKDEICTIALQFYVRHNKLNCTGIMRSNDIWYGLPYDTVFFTELQKYIAHRLNVEVGTYVHNVISLHCYERNYNDMYEVIAREPDKEIHIDIEQLDKRKRLIEAALNGFETKEGLRRAMLNLCKDYGVISIVEE